MFAPVFPLGHFAFWPRVTAIYNQVSSLLFVSSFPLVTFQWYRVPLKKRGDGDMGLDSTTSEPSADRRQSLAAKFKAVRPEQQLCRAFSPLASGSALADARRR